MALVRIRKFTFARVGMARLHLRRSYSNIFLTLTDLKNKVVQCKTSGSLVLLVVNDVRSHH
jgi:ribosomal protein S11